MKMLKLFFASQWPRGSWLLLLLLAGPAQAQFSATPSQTQFVCNATGNQFGVQAFADGAGGSYGIWIDKRNGNNAGPGTGIYAQHLDANGNALLPANGLRLFQTGSRDIFGLRAIAWQSGMLVAWVQGAFGVGGDTVRCQYYNAAGVAQWPQPTLIAARVLPNVVYESEQGLNIIPTSTGATITHALALTGGGGTRFTFNQVNTAGVRAYPNNSQQVVVLPPSNFALDYYHTVGDGADGFYMVASAGGLGREIYAQRFGAAGAAIWGGYTTISAGGASGRGSDWQLLTDPANSLYVAWTSNGGDPLAAKVLPGGALGWAAPGYVALSTDPAFQTNPHAIWHSNALWMIWEDARGGTGSFDYKCYAQKIDAAGTLAWAANGVPVYGLSAGAPRPKLAPSDNGSVIAFYTTDTNGANFRAQKILPTGGLAFAAPGVILHSVADNRPYELDYLPVGQPNGSVQVYWASPGAAPTGQDICVGRIQSAGTLLSATERAAEMLGFAVYPNPAAGELTLQFSKGAPPAGLRLYDAQGRVVRTFAEASALSVRGLPAGLYVLRATVAGQQVGQRVAVE